MGLGLGLLTSLAVTLLASGVGAIDAPPGAEDLRDGLEPLSGRFDAEKRRHRLLLPLSPA
jgi:hypothetical protein